MVQKVEKTGVKREEGSLSEEHVKSCVKQWLTNCQYKIASGKPRRSSLGKIDIRAHRQRDGRQWFIEAKGNTKSIRTDFLTGLGQILVHLGENPTNPATNFGFAVPDTEQWDRLVQQVPSWLRKKLRIKFLLVSNSGTVKCK
jgi:hypothetical protein